MRGTLPTDQRGCQEKTWTQRERSLFDPDLFDGVDVSAVGTCEVSEPEDPLAGCPGAAASSGPETTRGCPRVRLRVVDLDIQDRQHVAGTADDVDLASK